MVLLDDRELHFFNTTYDSFFDRQEQFIEQRKSNFAKQQHWINRRLRDGKGKFKYVASQDINLSNISINQSTQNCVFVIDLIAHIMC